MNLENIDILITNFLISIGIWGYIAACFCILIESILPILPLSVFITLLFYKFGPIIGFVLSYTFTILGCLISYKICNTRFRNILEHYIEKKNKTRFKKVLKRINRIKFNNLCLLIAIPFAPAFLINIAAGLANIDKRKYFLALLIGKIFLIIFWAFIGTSLINSIKHPLNLIYIGLMLLACFIISKLVEKKENLL